MTSLCQLHCVQESAVEISACVWCSWTIWQCIRAGDVSVFAQRGVYADLGFPVSAVAFRRLGLFSSLWFPLLFFNKKKKEKKILLLSSSFYLRESLQVKVQHSSQGRWWNVNDMRNNRTGLPSVSHFNIKDSECEPFRSAAMTAMWQFIVVYIIKMIKIFLFCPIPTKFLQPFSSFLVSLLLHPHCDTDLTFTLPFPIHFKQIWQ